MFAQPTLNSTAGFTLAHGGVAMSAGVASLSGSSDGFYPAAYTTTPADTDNFYTQMTLAGSIAAPNGSQNRIAGPGVRCNSTFTQGIYAAVDTTGIYIQTDTSGSGTPTTRASLSVSCSVGDVIKLMATGNIYTVYRNGSFAVNWTDSGALTSTGTTFRYGSLIVSRNFFTNSGNLSTMTIADMPYQTPLNQFVPMLRSSSW